MGAAHELREQACHDKLHLMRLFAQNESSSLFSNLRSILVSYIKYTMNTGKEGKKSDVLEKCIKLLFGFDHSSNSWWDVHDD
jgi:hypothetical protein